MDNLFQKIKQIKDPAPPFDISKNVFRRIARYKLKLPLLIAGLLFANFSMLCYQIGTRLLESGALAIVKVIIDDFEMSWDYIFESWAGLAEIMPAAEIWLLTVNLAAICLIAIFMHRNYKSQINKLLKVEF